METARYRVNPKVVWRDLGGKIYIYGETAATLHKMNEVGEFVWRTIAKRGKDGVPFEELVDAVVETFEVEREQALSDLKDFMGELVEKGLVLAER